MCSAALAHAQNTATTFQKKLQLCIACHGINGISSQIQWPNIAGQNQKYLFKQLHEIQLGVTRKVPSMSSILNMLSDEDMQDLSAYYAKMPITKTVASKRSFNRAVQLYKNGDYQQGIPACIICHGPTGNGNPQAGFPQLAGQHTAYTILQLQAFKNSLRTNDLNHIMHEISSRLSQEDIELLAHYIEELH